MNIESIVIFFRQLYNNRLEIFSILKIKIIIIYIPYIKQQHRYDKYN